MTGNGEALFCHQKVESMIDSYGWLVIYAKSKHEKKVHKELQKKGIESFLPLVGTVKQWSDRKKKVHEPLFPGYVFANIKSKMDFYNALTDDSAFAYVRIGKELGRVTDKEIDQLKLLVGEELLEDVQVNAELPSVGDKVIIEHGELSGLECEVYSINNKNKVSVWIKSINQNISATLPSHYFQRSVVC